MNNYLELKIVAEGSPVFSKIMESLTIQKDLETISEFLQCISDIDRNLLKEKLLRCSSLSTKEVQRMFESPIKFSNYSLMRYPIAEHLIAIIKEESFSVPPILPISKDCFWGSVIIRRLIANLDQDEFILQLDKFIDVKEYGNEISSSGNTNSKNKMFSSCKAETKISGTYAKDFIIVNYENSFNI